MFDILMHYFVKLEMLKAMLVVESNMGVDKCESIT